MSPFLFLLVVEGLSRIIKAYEMEGSIKGMNMGKSLFLSHVLFVDEVILFGLGLVSEAKRYK
jgi:hypothetical protein